MMLVTAPQRSSVTVIVPALNEEENLGPTLDKLLNVLPLHWKSWEILVFNDGSIDRTASVAEHYASLHREISVTHHLRPVSLGGVFTRGLALAKNEYTIMVHGQNAITERALSDIFSAPEKDLIVPYQVNFNERPFHRVLLSRSFVTLLNLAFRMNLKYYNHYVLYRTDVARSISLRTRGYAFQAEALIKLIKRRGHSFVEIPVKDDFSTKKKSNALKPSNVISTLRFFFSTLADIYGGRDHA